MSPEEAKAAAAQFEADQIEIKNAHLHARKCARLNRDRRLRELAAVNRQEAKADK